MFASAKKQLTQLGQETQVIAGYGVSYVEAFANMKLLLRNPEFQLIHVQRLDNGARHSMTVIVPALYRPTRKQVEWQGYCTVSHLWGPEEKCQPWTDHGIIGIDGQPIQVKIRPEKKETLLRLLSANPGFWWIDVFCAQSKTPPAIMGDVYRFCSSCCALVDFPSDGFPRIEAINASFPSFSLLDEFVEPYMRRISGKMSSENRSWRESVEDFLGGWYDGDPVDIKTLADFYGCQWFTRVWTIQECVLPPKLTFISEDGQLRNLLDRDTIACITRNLRTISSKVFEPYLPPNPYKGYAQDYHSLSREQHEFVTSTPGLSRCYFDLARFDAFYFFLDHGGVTPRMNWMIFRHVSSKFDPLVYTLALLARLPRRCMHTRDYIYGVAGLLDMKIPLADNDGEVWASFRKIVKKRAPYLEVPETSALSGARSMQDVYKAFIGIDNPNSLVAYLEYLH